MPSSPSLPLPHPSSWYQHFYYTTVGETQSLLSLMRRNRRWKTPLATTYTYDQHNDNINEELITPLTHLRTTLQYTHTHTHTDTHEYRFHQSSYDILEPFLLLILSNHTTGEITAAAIQSVIVLLKNGILRLHSSESSSASLHEGKMDGSIEETSAHRNTLQYTIERLIYTCYNCQYESTDTSSDELVLSSLMELQLMILQCEENYLLSDIDIWHIFTTAFHIYLRMRPPQYTDLLAHTSEQMLISIVETICQQASIHHHKHHDQHRSQHTHTHQHTLSSFSRALLRIMEFLCGLCESTHTSVYINDLTSMSSSSGNDISLNVNHPSHGSPSQVIYFAPFSFFKHCHKSDRLLKQHDFNELGIFKLHSLDEIASSSASSISTNATTIRLLHEWIQRTLLCCKLIESIIHNINESMIMNIPIMREYLADNIFKFLLRSANSTHATILSYTLKIFFQLILIMREHLSIQIETFINTVYLRILSSKLPTSASNSNDLVHSHDSTLIVDPSTTLYELRELVLESMYDLCKEEWFWNELYINYDSQPTATNLFDNVFTTLCKSALTMNNVLTGNHFLALRCLLEGLRWMNIRGYDSCSHHTSNNAPRVNELVHLLHSFREWKESFSNVVELFNTKPRKALVCMHESLGIFDQIYNIQDTLTSSHGQNMKSIQTQQIQQLAYLLKHFPDLDKISIGQFIAEPSHLHFLIRRAYVSEFDFHGLSLDDAMRMYLEGFRLPLEAQQIDRVVEEFARRYYQQNPHVLDSESAVHTLCFSLLMLNTDQHNAQVRHKMTLQQFINNNRGINAGKDVPRATLEELYHTIRRYEIKMSGDGVNGHARVNDALWCDMIRCRSLPHTHHSSSYIRMDTLDADQLNKVIERARQQLNMLPHTDSPSSSSSKSATVNGTVSPSRQSSLLNGATLSHIRSLNFDKKIYNLCSSPILAALTIIYESNEMSLHRRAASQPMQGTEGNSPAQATPIRNSTTPTTTSSTIDNSNTMKAHNTATTIISPSSADCTNSVPPISRPVSIEPTHTYMPASASTSKTLSISTSTSKSPPTISQSLLEGFELMASVSSLFEDHNTVDRLIGALARFTGLTSELEIHHPSRHVTQQNIDLFVYRLSNNNKALAAFATLFRIVHSHALHIRDGWKDITAIIHELYQLQLLPAQLTKLDDFQQIRRNEAIDAEHHTDSEKQQQDDTYTRAELLSYVPSEQPSPMHRSSSSNSWFSFFLAPSASGSHHPLISKESKSEEQIKAEKRARRYVHYARLHELIHGTRAKHDAFLHFNEALIESVSLRTIAATASSHQQRLRSHTANEDDIHMHHSAANGSITSAFDDMKLLQQQHYMDIPIELRLLLLNLQIITQMIRSHPDDIDIAWPTVKLYLTAILSSASTSSLPTPNLPRAASHGSNASLSSPPSQHTADHNEAGSMNASQHVTPSHSPSTKKISNGIPNDPITLNQLLPTLSLVHYQAIGGNNTTHLTNSTNNANMPTLSVEAAMVCFLQIATSLVKHSKYTDDVILLLRYIGVLDLRHRSLAEQSSAGVDHLIRTQSIHIKDASLWHTLLLLHVRFSEYIYSFDASFASFQHAIQSSTTLMTLDRTRLVLDIVIAFAKSRYCTPTTGRQCVDLLFMINQQLQKILLNVTPDDAPYLQLQWQWRACVRPLLVSFRAMCLISSKRLPSAAVPSPRSGSASPSSSASLSSTYSMNANAHPPPPADTWYTVRQHSLITLDHVLTHDALSTAIIQSSRKYSNHVKEADQLLSLHRMILDEIVLPLVDDMRDGMEQALSIELSRSQATSINILSNIYLKNIRLFIDKNMLQHVWFAVLKQLDRSLTLATRQYQALQKANKSTSSAVLLLDNLQESLKKMLLIMKTNHLFYQQTPSRTNPHSHSQSQSPPAATNGIQSPSECSPSAANEDSASVNEIYELTTSIISPFFPSLLEEIFPSSSSSSQSESQSSSSPKVPHANSMKHHDSCVDTNTHHNITHRGGGRVDVGAGVSKDLGVTENGNHQSSLEVWNEEEMPHLM